MQPFVAKRFLALRLITIAAYAVISIALIQNVAEPLVAKRLMAFVAFIRLFLIVA